MVILDFDKREFREDEIPTMRFKLMLKLRLNMDKNWEIYLANLRDRILAGMKVPGPTTSESEMEKKNQAAKMMKDIENSAWRTMPTSFLKALGIDRVLHH